MLWHSSRSLHYIVMLLAQEAFVRTLVSYVPSEAALNAASLHSMANSSSLQHIMLLAQENTITQ